MYRVISSLDSQDTPPIARCFVFKTSCLNFVLPVILTLGGLLVLAFGLGALGMHQGWWQAQLLSSISFGSSISMVVVGGLVGTFIFAIILVRCKSHDQPFVEGRRSLEIKKSAIEKTAIEKTAIEKTEIKKPAVHIHGPRVLEQYFKIKVIGEQSPPPQLNDQENDPLFPGKTFAETSFLVCPPERIQIEGEDTERELTLELLQELLEKHARDPGLSKRITLSADPGLYPNLSIFQSIRIHPGWIQFKKGVIPQSRSCTSYEAAKRLLEGTDYIVPGGLDLAYGILVHHLSTSEEIYEQHADMSRSCFDKINTYACCPEKNPSTQIRSFAVHARHSRYSEHKCTLSIFDTCNRNEKFSSGISGITAAIYYPSEKIKN